MSLHDAMLRAAAPEHRARVREALDGASTGATPAWASLQASVFDWVDEYLSEERRRSPDAHAGSHEAGGHLAVGFPHLRLRDVPGLREHMAAVVAARRSYVEAGGTPDDGEEFYHGWPDVAEVHHEIEAFLYFQVPLLYHDYPGAALAREGVEDVAHHVGNWVDGIPDWYDWDASEFRSRYLGTREVRAEPPDDYQEANHLRFVTVALAASLGTGEERYREFATDYCDRWCEHVAAHRDAECIPCSILPEGARAGEMGFAGLDDGDDYEVFYTRVAPNTATDVVWALQDAYRLTGRERYLDAARAMLDQFYEHGTGGRPAGRHEDGEWVSGLPDGEFDPEDPNRGGPSAVAAASLRHDVLLDATEYEGRVRRWAEQVDEAAVLGDQTAVPVMVAAHYYTGDPEWLERAHAMTLRAWGAVEDHEHYHMCSTANRQAVKSKAVPLYQPVFGGLDLVRSGTVPLRRLAHRHDGDAGLPRQVGFRTWRAGERSLGFEAVNRGDDAVAWRVVPADPVFGVDDGCPDALDFAGVDAPDGRLELAGGATLEGRVRLV